MLFPEVEKVIYNINPTDRVTCTLQFPAVTKANADFPAAFQKAIKTKYPIFSDSPKPSGGKVYEFVSKDGKWEVNLTDSSLSLSTKYYPGWEEFRDRLQNAFQVLAEIYALNQLTRVNIETVNIYVPSKLGLSQVAWKHLISPSLLGVLADERMAENIENAQNISLIQLSNTQTVLKVVTKTVRNQGSGEICLMLDMDLSETADKKIEQLTFTLNHLNAGSFRMMRWCIKDRLHKALQPKIVA